MIVVFEDTSLPVLARISKQSHLNFVGIGARSLDLGAAVKKGDGAQSVATDERFLQ